MSIRNPDDLSLRGERMNARQRFLAAMRFEEVDRLPMLTMGLWPETVERWRAEGMVCQDTEMAAFDGPMQHCWMYGEYQGPLPPFEEKVIAETDRYRDVQNSLGQVQRTLRGATAMPCALAHPVKDRRDWNAYRKRLDPTSPGRYPADWDAQVAARRDGPAAEEIRGVAVWGYYGFPRHMLGMEPLSVLFHEDPGLISEMNEFWCEFTLRRLQKAVREIRGVDLG